MDGRIVRCGIISSCQPAATHLVTSVTPVTTKKHYSKYLTFSFYHHCKQKRNLLLYRNNRIVYSCYTQRQCCTVVRIHYGRCCPDDPHTYGAVPWYE